MITTDSSRLAKGLAFFALAALLAVTATAQVATGTTGIDASGNYQQEVQACLQGKTQQDQATCLTEARNSQADKKRGVLETGAAPGANAAARCDALSGTDKADCQARVAGSGKVDGSVSGGGVIRETETPLAPAATRP